MSSLAIVNVGVANCSDGSVRDDGVIVVEGDRIVSIGSTVPNSAEQVIDGDGAIAYPGMFAAVTTLGITGLSGQHDDATEHGAAWPELDTHYALNSNDETIAVSRMEGVTGAMAASGYTSIFGGTTVAFHLSDDLRSSVLRPRAMQLINLEYELPVPTVLDYMANAKTDGPTTPGGVFAFVRDALAAARGWAGDARSRALREILDRRIRVLFMTNDQVGIRQALELIDEFSLDAVVQAKADVVPFAAAIASRGIPVIWDGTSAPPRPGEEFDRNYSAAAQLDRAGVDFCIGVPNWGPWRDTGSRPASQMVRTIPQCAAQSVAYGLDEARALRAISLNAARVVLGDPHGDLSEGSCADFALWSGSPLQLSSRVSEVFVAGTRVVRESFQTRLRDNSAPSA